MLNHPNSQNFDTYKLHQKSLNGRKPNSLQEIFSEIEEEHLILQKFAYVKYGNGDVLEQ